MCILYFRIQFFKTYTKSKYNLISQTLSNFIHIAKSSQAWVLSHFTDRKTEVQMAKYFLFQITWNLPKASYKWWRWSSPPKLFESLSYSLHDSSPKHLQCHCSSNLRCPIPYTLSHTTSLISTAHVLCQVGIPIPLTAQSSKASGGPVQPTSSHSPMLVHTKSHPFIFDPQNPLLG